MNKKISVIFLAATLAVASGCNNAQPAAKTTASTSAPAAGYDIREECEFYVDNILYYDSKLLSSEDGLFNSMFEGDFSGLKKAVEQCRDTLVKIVESDCPCEQISEQHENMISNADEYARFLDSMERYAYYLKEGQSRTDFTDEEMIELQELSEIIEDPYKTSAAFQESRLAAIEAASNYIG